MPFYFKKGKNVTPLMYLKKCAVYEGIVNDQTCQNWIVLRW